MPKAISMVNAAAVIALAASSALSDPLERDSAVLWEDFNATGAERSDIHLSLDGHSRAEVVPDMGTAGGSALRVDYEGGEMGSHRVIRSFELDEKLTEATLSYDVMFDDNFQFVRGGKMHGLGPESPIAGGNPMEPDRWSGRVMWGSHEGPQTYLYVQNKSGNFGVARNPDDGFTFDKGRYYAVSLHIKLNDLGETNGFAHIYVDGERTVTHDNLRWRDEDGDETLIQTFMFNTFHGGNDPSWAPVDGDGNFTTVNAYYDNFAVHEGLHARPHPVPEPAAVSLMAGLALLLRPARGGRHG